jgi:hypothetical protein
MPIDLLSGVIGAVCVSVPFCFFVLWVAARAYEMGWHDRNQGRWIGGGQEKEENDFR